MRRENITKAEYKGIQISLKLNFQNDIETIFDKEIVQKTSTNQTEERQKGTKSLSSLGKTRPAVPFSLESHCRRE
jgi:hypothetical protein